MNAVCLIVTTKFGIVMDGKAIAFSNALLPNSVSCESFSNVNEVNDEQLLNESQPIYVTVLDIIIDCKPEYENVPFSIYVTEFGITMDVKLEQSKKTSVPILVNRELASNVTEVKSPQYLKAFFTIVVTVFGIVIEVRPEDANAESPIVVKALPESNVTEVRPEVSNAPPLISVTEDGIVIDVNADVF